MPGFTMEMLRGVDQPVRRYFSDAVSDGAPLPQGVRMAMSGRSKVGLWRVGCARAVLWGFMIHRHDGEAQGHPP